VEYDKQLGEFTGEWGIHKLHGTVEGHNIPKARLGDTAVELSGEVAEDNKSIIWSTGQLWLRAD
jgi:hypothetical protein